MSPVFDFLFGQYSGYKSVDVFLEITAVIFGLISVGYAKKNSIWVYPTGMISTSIFVYLLLKWTLLGDMLINAYYFIMSAYGWYYWSKKKRAGSCPSCDRYSAQRIQNGIGAVFGKSNFHILGLSSL